MVASRQVEDAKHKAVGRQMGRESEALAQVIGRTAVPFFRKHFVPAAKRIGADMLEFAASDIGEVISGRKSFKSAAMSVGKPTLKKQLGIGSKQRRIIRSLKQPSLNTREFCIVKAMTMNRILRIILTPYLIPFSQGEENC